MAPIPKPANDTAEVRRIRTGEEIIRFERAVDTVLDDLLGHLPGDFVRFNLKDSPLLHKLFTEEQARTTAAGALNPDRDALAALRKTIAQAYAAYLRKNRDETKLHNGDYQDIIAALKKIDRFFGINEAKPRNLLAYIDKHFSLAGYEREQRARERLIGALMPYRQLLVEHHALLEHAGDNKNNQELKYYRALNDVANVFLAGQGEMAHDKQGRVIMTDQEKRLLNTLSAIKIPDVLPEKSIGAMLQEHWKDFKEKEAEMEKEKAKAGVIILSHSISGVPPVSGLPAHLFGKKGAGKGAA